MIIPCIYAYIIILFIYYYFLDFLFLIRIYEGNDYYNMMITMHNGPYDYGDHRLYAYAVFSFIYLILARLRVLGLAHIT